MTIYVGYVEAVSRRGGPANPNPLRHAVGRRVAGPVGARSTFDAACGAQVAKVIRSGFDSEHPRACPRCRRALA